MSIKAIVFAAFMAASFCSLADGWSTIDIREDSPGRYSYEVWDWGSDYRYGSITRSSRNTYEIEENGHYREIEIERDGSRIEINTWDW